jgi:CelD/BcsL family acetyltransferase involved in cellulose biosynthesis
VNAERCELGTDTQTIDQRPMEGSDMTLGLDLDVAVIGSERQFRALSGEWDTLFKGAPRATPFQSWSWLSAWWSAYGDPRVLRVITVRRGGQLVGVLPLMLDRRLGRARLGFIGTGLSDHLDGLVLEGMEDEVVAAWVRALRALGGWTVLDLHEVRPSAVVWGLYERWSLAVAIPQSTCLEVVVAPWEDVLADMSRNARKAMRRAVRAADEAGIVARPVSGAEVGAAIDTMLEQHRAQWAERTESITDEHLSDRFHVFLREAVVEMVQHEQAALIEFCDENERLATNLFLIGQDYVGDYMYSATPRALDEFSIAPLYTRAGLELAEECQLPTLNLLRGDEPWKRRWQPEEQVSHRLLLGRARPSWAAFAGYRLLRVKAAAYVRSEASPEWLYRLAKRAKESL